MYYLQSSKEKQTVRRVGGKEMQSFQLVTSDIYQVMSPNLIVATEIILIVVLCGLIVLAFTMCSTLLANLQYCPML
jgi:hypothetical protein